MCFHSITQKSEAWSNDKKEMIQSFSLELLRFSNSFPVPEKERGRAGTAFLCKGDFCCSKGNLQSNSRLKKKKEESEQINATISVSVLKNKGRSSRIRGSNNCRIDGLLASLHGQGWTAQRGCVIPGLWKKRASWESPCIAFCTLHIFVYIYYFFPFRSFFHSTKICIILDNFQLFC